MGLLAEFAACRTEGDFYRVQIPAENTMTPTEVEALAAQAGALPDPARAWIRRLHGMARRVHPVCEAYRRRELAPSVLLFEGDRPHGAPRDLVVAMAGVALRLMMPTPVVLQALPAARCDVLLLADESLGGFLNGIPGLGTNPAAVVERLAVVLPLERYDAIRMVGTSVGGAAALCYGVLLGARVAISLGGAHPVTLRNRIGRPAMDPGAFGALHAAHPKAATRLLSAFGTDSLRDAVRGGLLSAGLPGSRVVAVTGVSQHGLVAGLFLRDVLRRFMAELLLSDDTWPGGAWQP